MRIAIIGLGMAAGAACQEPDRPERADRGRSRLQPDAGAAAGIHRGLGLSRTGDIEAIFADRSIDAVLVLAPPNTHLELVERATAAGKHVLLEKPLEISLARAERLVAAAEQAGVKLGIVLQHRFRPVAVALAGLIAQDRLARSSAPRQNSPTGGRKAITTSRAGNEGARRRRRAADAGHPHARPADLAGRPAGGGVAPSPRPRRCTVWKPRICRRRHSL